MPWSDGTSTPRAASALETSIRTYADGLTAGPVGNGPIFTAALVAC